MCKISKTPKIALCIRKFHFYPASSCKKSSINYRCRATIINAENPTVITEVVGTHLVGLTDADVKSFDVFGLQLLTGIP